MRAAGPMQGLWATGAGSPPLVRAQLRFPVGGVARGAPMLHPGTWSLSSVPARLLLVLALLAPALATAQTTREIFRIERSKNKDVVRYDAKIGKDGQLDPKEPVVSYWLLRDGKRREVNAFSRTFFYGFKVRKDKRGDFWHLTIVTAKDRTMKLYLKDGKPLAEGRIAKRTGFLQKLYVQFVPNATIPKVAFVDLIGVDAKTGERIHERVVP
jgi:hypothetical protein